MAVTRTQSINDVGANSTTVLTVTTGTTSVQLLPTDRYVEVNNPNQAVNVVLPANPAPGEQHYVHDASGAAALFPITVYGNGKNIEVAGHTFDGTASGGGASLQNTGTITATGLVGMTSASIGHYITFFNPADPRYVGTFVIIAVASPSSITITNTNAPFSPDLNNGFITWTTGYAISANGAGHLFVFDGTVWRGFVTTMVPVGDLAGTPQSQTVGSLQGVLTQAASSLVLGGTGSYGRVAQIQAQTSAMSGVTRLAYDANDQTVWMVSPSLAFLLHFNLNVATSSLPQAFTQFPFPVPPAIPGETSSGIRGGTKVVVEPHLTSSGAGVTITSPTTATLSSLSTPVPFPVGGPGQLLKLTKISGTGANAGTFTVAAINGTTITIEAEPSSESTEEFEPAGPPVFTFPDASTYSWTLTGANVYVLGIPQSGGPGVVIVYTRSGQPIGLGYVPAPVAGQAAPTSLCLDNQGNVWVTTNLGSGTQGSLWQFSIADMVAAYPNQILPKSGLQAGLGSPGNPNDVTFDGTFLYVCNAGGNKVFKVNPTSPPTIAATYTDPTYNINKIIIDQGTPGPPSANTLWATGTLLAANNQAALLQINTTTMTASTFPFGFGSTASITSVTSGIVTITGLANMTANAVGKNIKISGAATVANNGSFLITSFISASSVTYVNASAVAPDGNNGAISWVEPNNININGIAVDGTNVYLSDQNSNNIFVFTKSGPTFNSTVTPKFSTTDTFQEMAAFPSGELLATSTGSQGGLVAFFTGAPFNETSNGRFQGPPQLSYLPNLGFGQGNQQLPLSNLLTTLLALTGIQDLRTSGGTLSTGTVALSQGGKAITLTNTPTVGQLAIVTDFVGNASGGTPLTVAPGPSGYTINGSTASQSITTAFGSLVFFFTGVVEATLTSGGYAGNWIVVAKF